MNQILGEKYKKKTSLRKTEDFILFYFRLWNDEDTKVGLNKAEH
jgi:hypothetical protein